MPQFKEVEFKGNHYILVAGETLATVEQYRHGQCSFAHIFRERGEVWRFGEVIGKASDVKETGRMIDVELADDAWAGLVGPSWPIWGGLLQ